MRILVLMKQVPAPSSVRFLPQINRIAREGGPQLLNPLDDEALAFAFQLAGAEGEVIAATMGPPPARAVLEHALDRGAQRAIHLLDMAFAGADTLATARALARLVAREHPDLVVGGRTTLDGATAQVVPQLAEFAGIPSLTEAETVTLVGREVEITRRERGRSVSLRAPLPAAVSVAGPPVHQRRGAGDRTGCIEEVDAEALGGDVAGYGIRGSATYVQAVEQRQRVAVREDLSDPAAALRRLEQLATARPAPIARDAPPIAGTAELWVVVEQDGDHIAAVSLEALAAARAVASDLAAGVVALCFGDAAGLAPRLAAAGADKILALESPELDARVPETFTAALTAALARRQPLAVLGQWTVAQRDWLARVAARRAVGMTGDVIGLALAPRPGSADVTDLVWLKPAWSGSVLARVVARTVPSFGTLRPGALTPLAGPERELPILRLDLGPLGAIARPHAHVSQAPPPDDTVPAIEGAGVVVLAGGQLDETDLAATRALAGHLAAVVVRTPDATCEEPIVSATTHALSPRLAIAVGVRDAAHLVPVGFADALVCVGTRPHGLDVDLFVDCPPRALAAELRAAPAP